MFACLLAGQEHRAWDVRLNSFPETLFSFIPGILVPVGWVGWVVGRLDGSARLGGMAHRSTAVTSFTSELGLNYYINRSFTAEC